MIILAKKYTFIKSKYLAHSLGYIGFRFELRYDENGNTIYTFEETSEFLSALFKLQDLAKTYRK